MTSALDKAIEIEWDMFDKTKNVGGRASCQEDYATFRIMRLSQHLSWPQELLARYCEELKEASEKGRNLISEKYAWMMESTHPQEFESIKGLLSVPTPKALDLIDMIATVELEWAREVFQKYPNITRRGRVMTYMEDDAGNTSQETYARGEMKTYSETLLEMVLAYVQSLKTEGKNLHEMIIKNMVTQYGYTSLAEAEALATAPR